nr:uncharacterized protein LOC131783281 [Pocillopora verrucosa]
MDRELEGIIDKINLLPEDEKQQDKRDLKELQEKTERMNSHARETIRSLRAAAKKLDNVWRDCKTAHAVGTSVGILGGLLSIGGGIATVMTAGTATPLLVAGLSLGGAGATTNIGAAAVEALINSAEIKKAEEQLGETMNSINEVNRIVQKILMAKETARLIYIYYLAKTLKLGGPAVLKILRELVFFSAGTPTKMVVQVAETVMACAQTVTLAGAKAATQGGAQGAGKAAAQSVDDVVRATGQAGAQAADDVVQAGARAGSKAVGEAVGKVVIVVNVAFVVWDAIDLGFTIRDLVENKGSEAAKVLRQKADKLESAMK